jgi:RimJ/RimL family protein N-acetyltransferase
MESKIVIETGRLLIRTPTTSDADVNLFYDLYTDPRVMTMVGFPGGLPVTRQKLRGQIESENNSEFNQKLIVELKGSQELIGECKLGLPDKNGISETDVKLRPQFWGNRFGTEIKRALVNYLFEHTDCRIVQATPHKENIASQKMQEAVGGKRVGESVFRFPESQKSWTCDVPHYVYHVFREDWQRSALQKPEDK